MGREIKMISEETQGRRNPDQNTLCRGRGERNKFLLRKTVYVQIIEYVKVLLKSLKSLTYSC